MQKTFTSLCHGAFPTGGNKMGGVGQGFSIESRHELDEVLALASISIPLELDRTPAGFKTKVPTLTARPAADEETIKTMCAVTLADPYRTKEWFSFQAGTTQKCVSVWMQRC